MERNSEAPVTFQGKLKKCLQTRPGYLYKRAADVFWSCNSSALTAGRNIVKLKFKTDWEIEVTERELLRALPFLVALVACFKSSLLS